ncbi:MAG: hypothetical protein RR420_01435 [Anaerovoracaceae bacterium]
MDNNKFSVAAYDSTNQVDDVCEDFIIGLMQQCVEQAYIINGESDVYTLDALIDTIRAFCKKDKYKILEDRYICDMPYEVLISDIMEYLISEKMYFEYVGEHCDCQAILFREWFDHSQF